ncbi:ATP-dependent DNA helicase [Zavarzinia sp. CC-PAN008]|uniref:ATP-dependent DNA helicase n=1 Tax=Zavarzinia sp. CC-PAN008 TaxID=3243332 RepID=UPI003F743CCF
MASPDLVALVAVPGRLVSVSASGEVDDLNPEDARALASAGRLLCVHAPSLARRLGLDRLAGLDLLELFAFVHPARFCLPSPRGLAAALDLDVPDDPVDQALALHRALALLLGTLAAPGQRGQAIAARVAAAMGQAGWPWAPAVLQALGGARDGPGSGFDVWTRLPEWEEPPPEGDPLSRPVSEDEARQALAGLLHDAAEARPQQADYAALAAGAFAPRLREGAPSMVLAEAGTGIGKTLGYIAPASVFAAKNGGPVWLSTYTRVLQRQLDRELSRLYPVAAEKAAKVVVRKGRENYLCLLNFEDQARQGPPDRPDRVALGLIARWAEATRDGDMVGGDFPAWAGDLLGVRVSALTDRRGECIHSACPHYRKCFIERGIRKARQAEIVVANHALVMITAARAVEGRDIPLRIVFDEGHHVFDAADGAFSAHLTGVEAADLRRWVRGHEEGRRARVAQRARGLTARISDLVIDDADADRALADAHAAAAALPGEGWLARIQAGNPVGPAETFLSALRTQVLARTRNQVEGSLRRECEKAPALPEVLAAASGLDAALERLQGPLQTLVRRLRDRLDEDAETLDSAARARLDAAARGIERRVGDQVGPWRAMLRELDDITPEGLVDLCAIDRAEGRELDCGLHRHWVDPTQPFARVLLDQAHGALITSATLRDRSHADSDWQMAEMRTGAHHLVLPPRRASLPSPFDYASRTRVFVVTDVRRDAPDDVAAAYRTLFLAAGGGALGLFTAISRLRGVHQRIHEALETAGLDLLAQHVDPLDVGTLIDLFRAERDSCLLGTDAVRDGVDVPGQALRLIVFDRVPWPRPDLLHKARKAAFGGTAYDDMLTRLRLKQAFGRLIRRQDDMGVFVILDAMTPTRLLDAFPDGVAVQRVGLAEAVAGTRQFLDSRRP